ncbi:hypothetical protein [Colwellia sp. MT41]|nr:hypothetical protein [Colwellia sp. MT41]
MYLLVKKQQQSQQPTFASRTTIDIVRLALGESINFSSSPSKQYGYK